MTTSLWDTTGSDIVKALTQARRTAGGVTSGLALTLVVIVDEHSVTEAENAATVAAAAHPSRLLIVVRRDVTAEQSRLDAEICVGERLGPGEAVVMRMYGRLALHAESVVLPLLAPDVPVVTWWHGAPPDVIAEDPLGVLADRRITDCAQSNDPLAALHQRARDYVPGDTDLAWTRATVWRSLIAGAFDAVDSTAVRVQITGVSGNPTAALLAGWLSARLGVTVAVEAPGNTEVASSAERENGSSAEHEHIRSLRVQLANSGEVSVEWNSSRADSGDSGTALVRHTGLPDRRMPLRQPTLGEHLAEELRHLDPDQLYEAALATATRMSGLETRARSRVHIWRDPAAK